MTTVVKTETTLILERPAEIAAPAPYRGSLLAQIVTVTEESHPDWEGKFEKFRYEWYCKRCGSRGKDVCEAVARCVRVKNQ